MIYVVLAKSQFPHGDDDLPTSLRLLLRRNSHRIVVIWTERDIGPFKKLLPVRQLNPGLAIITVDDDVLYPRNLVSQLAAMAAERPGVVVGTRGAKILRDRTGGVAAYSSWPRAYDSGPDLSIVLTGRGGIYYPADSLSPRVQEIDLALQLCPRSDDLWFKAMAIISGTLAYVGPQNREFVGTERAGLGLHVDNVEGGGNDAAWKALCEEFGLLELLNDAESI